jgi:glycosyltransferase involved in cell wall biosynthesis
VLLHIHELAYAFRLSLGEQQASEVFHRTSRFVAASNAVRALLSREFNVRDDLLDLVYEFVPVTHLGAEERRSRRERIRKQLGWSGDAFVVGGCGSLGWRKGTDLFLQIARAVSNMKGSEKARFLWIGGGAEDKQALEFAHDLRTLGLEGRCCRIPDTADMVDYYCAMDVLAVTSREDPFPLVMLEAGSHSIPVVCFKDSGGGPEFVGEDAGLIAPYLDITAFASHLMRLQNAPDLREQLGTAASTKVRMHYSVEVQAPKLLKIIERCLSISAADVAR